MKYIKYNVYLFVIFILIFLSLQMFSIVSKEYQIQRINYYHLDYIEIKSVQILVPLLDGITNDHLNLNRAVIEKIDDNLIIAGHGIPNVFGNLKNVLIHDEIELFFRKTKTKYSVIDKYIVNVHDFSNFDVKNCLILITCLSKDERLIVLAQKK